MKAALYARALTTKSTGRGFIARELVIAMAGLAQPPQIELFSGEPVDLPNCRPHAARGSNLLSDLWRVYRGVARDVSTLNVDVFWGATHFLPRRLPKDLPKVVTLLDVVWKDHPETVSAGNRIAAGWMEHGLHAADRIACISEFTRSRLVAHWPGLADRADVVPLAPNPRLKAAAAAGDDVLRRHGLSEPYVLNVDTFEPRKDLRTALEAVRKIEGLGFVHCGHPGWKSEADLAFAKSLPRVRLLGYVPEADLAQLYVRAVACVFPTLYEGFHLPPLDALSLGVPVVVSDIPVHREVLGDAALYFPVRDVPALGEQIRELITKPKLREELGRKGRERARQFSWDRSAARMLEILGKAL
jgi:glycosyltransferase involved in cell wall biosynthesis